MKTIPVVIIDDVAVPSEPIPDDAVLVVCDGVRYVVYQPGDDLPPAV